MTAADREAAARRQRAQEIALWRWTLVEPGDGPCPDRAAARAGGAGPGVPRAPGARREEGPACRGGRSTGGSLLTEQRPELLLFRRWIRVHAGTVAVHDQRWRVG